MSKSLFSLFYLFCFVFSYSQTIYYVSHNGNDSGAGTSWASSFGTVQKALDTAAPNDEIRIETGTFFPTEIYDANQTDPRFRAFHCDKKLNIKGGYPYGSTTQDFNSRTIFSGDFNGNDVEDGSGETFIINGMEENAYHVMIIKNVQSPFIISNIKFIGGHCKAQLSNSYYEGQNIKDHFGGGLYVFNGNIQLNDVRFEKNKTDETIFNNGAGLYLINSHLIVENSSFALNDGTPIYTFDTNVNFSQCEFVNNSASQQSSGGVKLEGIANGEINHCFFSHNYADNYGGAIFSNINLHIDHCNFNNNFAGNSGGAVFGNLNSNLSSFTEISQCEFKQNESGTTGGAIYFNHASNIEKSIFINNHTSNNGGAIMVSDTESDVSNFKDLVFENNFALSGGGIFSSGTFNLENAIFYSNANLGNTNAQDIYLNGNPATVTNGTFFRSTEGNSARSIRLNDQSQLTISNSVFYNPFGDINMNTTASINSNSTNNASSLGDSSALYNTPNFLDLSSYTPSQLFINPANPIGPDQTWATDDDGLYPKSTSVIKDTGMDGINTLTTDLAGEVRYTGIIDLGPYEYNGHLNIDDLPEENSDFTLFPTICSSSQLLKITSSENVQIKNVRIFDVNGQLLLDKRLTINEFNLPNLQEGIYILKLTSENGKMYTTKIVVR